MKSKLINFRLNDDIKAQLLDIQKKDKRTISELIRQSIVEFIKKYGEK